MNYLLVIKYATLAFPIVAFLFTTPFILIEYHKFGSISFFKSIITYLFIYYLLCAYFLVILPLPKISEVAHLNTPRTQLIPFCFVLDFIKHSSFELFNKKTYLLALKESYFYVPLLNIILTIPFGIFLRYYFEWDKKKVIGYSFLLSLFFELTQLTGLYFLYPRGYRLFDVDDLFLNTMGGMIGYFVSAPMISILPKVSKINHEIREKGKMISGFRRCVALSLDLFLLFIMKMITILLFGARLSLSILLVIIYYFIIPLFLSHSTLGQSFLNIQVLNYDNQKRVGSLFFRRVLFFLLYIVIPIFIVNCIFRVENEIIREFAGMILIGVILLIDFITIIKYTFTSKDMLYEKISKTKLVSTIK